MRVKFFLPGWSGWVARSPDFQFRIGTERGCMGGGLLKLNSYIFVMAGEEGKAGMLILHVRVVGVEMQRGGCQSYC